jgi:hypothetical protein
VKRINGVSTVIAACALTGALALFVASLRAPAAEGAKASQKVASSQKTASGNLVYNGSFERGAAGGPLDQVDIPGWDMEPMPGKFHGPDNVLREGRFTVVSYGTTPAPIYTSENPAFPKMRRSSRAGSKVLFVGSYGGGMKLTQRVDLTPYKGLISSGRAYAIFSADVAIGPGTSKSTLRVSLGYGPRGGGVLLSSYPPATGKEHDQPVMELWRSSPPDTYRGGRKGWTHKLSKGVRYADITILSMPGWERSFWQCGFVDDIRLELTTNKNTKGASAGGSTKRMYSPSVTVQPASVAPGDTGKISGTGWKPLQTVQIKLGHSVSGAVTIRTRTTDKKGEFAWYFDVKPLASPGDYVIVACQEDCARRASTPFVITNPAAGSSHVAGEAFVLRRR